MPLWSAMVVSSQAHGSRLTTWMRTIGACQVRISSAASQRCLRSCMRAIVRPCCCTSCCTELTCKSQGSAVRLPPDQLAQLALASSSRSQVAISTARATLCLTWERSSVSVRWRPPLAVAIATHLVTRLVYVGSTTCLQNPHSLSRTVHGPGLTASAGPLKSAMIRLRWRQPWMSPTGSSTSCWLTARLSAWA